jgi:ABC-type dipeptide/oligopeptide/nickel transport system permease component
MITFIIRRLLTLIPLLFGISMLVFLLMSLTPGDYLTKLQADKEIPSEFIQQQKQQFGLAQPWYIQYCLWLKNVSTLNFGKSFHYKVEITTLLAQRIPSTLLLALLSLIFSWSIGIPLGILAAIYKDSIFDKISALLAYAALSVPEFFLALIALFFAAQTGLFPIGGFTSYNHDFMTTPEKFCDIAHHIILPTIVLGIGGIAGIMRIMRANFMDTMRAEFVKTARAKGLSSKTVMLKHVLRNAINPLITIFGFSFSTLISGSLIVEIVMNYPGVGKLVYDAFLQEDHYLVMGSVMISAIMLITGNLLADILLALSDPRIRLEKK